MIEILILIILILSSGCTDDPYPYSIDGKKEAEMKIPAEED